MSRHTRRQVSAHPLTTLLATTALLTACGGGSGDTKPAVDLVLPQEPAITLATISGTVADGPLSGVTVCYDLNDNGVCDAGEPASAPTDADGHYSLSLDGSLTGAHAVIAMVPAGAIDKDTGAPVGTGYTLRSPATGVLGDQKTFVSPLTTLVQAHIEATGASTADASAFVKSQAGMSLSPLGDFTAQTGDEAKQAASIAHMAMLTWQAQAASVAGIVGQVDLSGTAATQADVDRAVVRAVLSVLPAVAAATSEQAVVSAATPAEQAQALAQAAQTIVATQSGLTIANALASIGIAKLPIDTAKEATAPGATLPMLRYVDADNWLFRALVSSGADATVDANGQLHYQDLRSQRVAGVTSTWGFGNSPERDTDLHWSGSAWVACPLGTRSATTPRDASGRNTYDYCDGYESGISARTSVDLAGKSLRSVTETIRTAPGSQLGVSYADWGPTDLSLLGTTAFPDGAKLFYQTNTALQTGPAYDVRASNLVSVSPAAVAAGGDARNGGSPVCAASIPAGSPNSPAPAASLEALAERNPGQPCMLNRGSNANGNSGDTNEWWTVTTVSLGSVTGAATVPAGTGAYYTANALLRVSFVPGTTTARFYNCLQRADGSVRNCSLLSSGTYSIETLGDARVMRFSGLPAMAQRLSYARVFVEREGKVYYGYQNPVGVTVPSVRLNLAAANAMFSQLGMATLAP